MVFEARGYRQAALVDEMGQPVESDVCLHTEVYYGPDGLSIVRYYSQGTRWTQIISEVVCRWEIDGGDSCVDAAEEGDRPPADIPNARTSSNDTCNNAGEGERLC